MIEIRNATPHDYSALVQLYREFFTLHRLFLGNPNPLGEAEVAEIAIKSIEKSDSWLLVAFDDVCRKIVAFARWEERDGAFFGQEIYVRESYRKRGVAKRIMETVEQEVIGMGGDALFISIVPHNRQMLAYAYEHGYDTLNTIELRKDLKERHSRREKVKLFGLEFKII